MAVGGEASIPEGYAEVASAPPPGPRTRRSLNDIVGEIMAAHDLVANTGGAVWRHNGAWWDQLTGWQLEKLALDHGGQAALTPDGRKKIVSLLTLRVMREHLDWGRVADYELPCRSGVLSLRGSADFEVRGHSPDDMLERVLPFDYNPRAECPVWERALERYFGDAESSEARALEEFAGYCLMPHARLKKALLLLGKGNTGKSKIFFVLRNLVGSDATITLPPRDFGDSVKLTALQGKLLNVVGEVSSRDMQEGSALKQLVSTEEPVFLNPKHKAPFAYVPIAKHALASNDLPPLKGRTQEVFDRFLIIPMSRAIREAERDDRLDEKLLEEMPGIFAWAVRGAARLLAQGGRFTEPWGRAKVLSNWRREASPVIDWMSEFLVPKPGNRLPQIIVARRISDYLRRGVSATEVGKAARELGMETALARPGEGEAPIRCILDQEVRGINDYYPHAPGDDSDIVGPDDATPGLGFEAEDGHAPAE